MLLSYALGIVHSSNFQNYNQFYFYNLLFNKVLILGSFFPTGFWMYNIKVMRSGSRIRELMKIPAPTLFSGVTLDKLMKFSKPHLLHLYNGDNNNTYLTSIF